MKILKILFMLMGYLATIFLAFLAGIGYCEQKLFANEAKAKATKAIFESFVGSDKTKKETETKSKKIPIGFR